MDKLGRNNQSLGGGLEMENNQHHTIKSIILVVGIQPNLPMSTNFQFCFPYLCILSPFHAQFSCTVWRNTPGTMYNVRENEGSNVLLLLGFGGAVHSQKHHPITLLEYLEFGLLSKSFE
jgi:uncharacterized membrane protein